MNFRNFGAIILLLAIALFSAGVFNSGCYLNDDETRVTIRLQRNDLGINHIIPEKRMIDRVLEFLSSRAEATIPPNWSNIKGDMVLTVSSSLFDDKVYNIPAAATSYTVIVPAVSNVTFQIVSVDGGKKNWGGHTTVSLVPGEHELLVKMIPMVTFMGSVDCCIGLYWDDMTSGPSNANGFNIYRSENIDGPYEKIATINSISTYYYYDNGSFLKLDTTYYYKISVFGSDGEGVLSDPISALNNS